MNAFERMTRHVKISPLMAPGFRGGERVWSMGRRAPLMPAQAGIHRQAGKRGLIGEARS